jgi:hypothetical protein
MIGNKEKYYILPLDISVQDSWTETFQLDEDTYAACVASWQRTMELVGDGLEKAQNWMDEAHAEKTVYLSDPNRPWETEPATEPITEPSQPVETTVPTEPEAPTE